MSSNKEEEDKAWWSDYQASTKLRRKWAKEKKSDPDDFDDILGDLDDIVNKSDIKSVTPTKFERQRPESRNVTGRARRNFSCTRENFRI